jgi:hypothetical protein
MTTHVRLQCSAVLAILVVVATAGNLWAGEWRETPFFTEDFAPDPGWDTFLDGSAQLGYPEENFIRVVNERMVADMGGVMFGAYCGAAPTAAQLAPIEDVQATCIVRMEVLTDDLYTGLLVRGNNLDDMLDLTFLVTGTLIPTTGTAYSYVVSGNDEGGYPNKVGIYNMYYEPGDLPDHAIGNLDPITLPPWDDTDLIDHDIYMKFSARTTPEGNVQLDGMLSMSPDFSNPFGVVSRLDDSAHKLVGEGRVAVAGGNFIEGGGFPARSLWDDVAVYEHSGPGDANGDGSVDDTDASILGANWLKQSGATWGMGDFNEDGKVNDQDAAIMAANWAPAGTGSSVPEPGTLVLLASAAAALCFRRRR